MSRVRAVVGVRVLSLVLAASVVAGGCVTNPATGKREFSLMTVQQEIELGAQADQQIVAEFGLYNDQAIANYVTNLGNRIAQHAENPGYGFTFRVLDSPVINAFALPGGYIYVTRGLLAHLDNDAQLAVVLGHEIGHVTARHSARAYTSAQLMNIGVGLGGAIFEEVRPFLGAVQTGLQLLTLKFSRANETESDDLGVKYATRAGFEAKEGAEFFRSLKRLSEAEMADGGRLPTWASTHPDPGDREVNVTNLAASYASQLAPTGGLGGVNSAEYNGRLDNLVFGPDPRHGFVESGVFNHPELRFRFQVPSGWQVANFAALVQMAPSNGEAVVEMSTVSGGTPSAVASSFVSQTGATVNQPAQSVTVNGLSAVRLVSSLNMDNGQGGVIPLTIMSYFIAKENLVYVFHGYTVSQSFASYQNTFESTFRSFAPLTDQGALSVQPYRLDVFNAPRAAAFSALVSPPGQKRGVPITVDELEMAIMNQREVNETVPAGTPLKRIE